jgi:hypothetical protein
MHSPSTPVRTYSLQSSILEDFIAPEGLPTFSPVRRHYHRAVPFVYVNMATVSISNGLIVVFRCFHGIDSQKRRSSTKRIPETAYNVSEGDLLSTPL